MKQQHVDVVIGSGVGGGSVALQLAGSGAKVLVLERGLANSSDVMGRHYMTHNTTALMVVHPFKRNTTNFPKTLAVHDFYFGESAGRGSKDTPLGSLELLGKLREPMLRGPLPAVPKFVRNALDATLSIPRF